MPIETFGAALAVNVSAAIDRIGQDIVDRSVARRDPADLGLGVGLERKGQAFGAEPEPDAAGRAQLGEAVEDGADGGRDGDIRMETNLTIPVTPDKAHGQATT